MTTGSPKAEQFSGLILLTGDDKPGLAHSLFEALAPFSVSVIDVDQIIIKERLILTVQIALNPVHQGAIEQDLTSLATTLGIDIAAVFSTSIAPQPKPTCLFLKIKSAKLHPKGLSRLTKDLFIAGANIEDITRTASDPLEITLKISGISEGQLTQVVENIGSNPELSLFTGA